MNYHYADQNNQPVGPITLDELIALKNKGTVQDATLIFVEGAADWQPFSALQIAPPPPKLAAIKDEELASRGKRLAAQLLNIVGIFLLIVPAGVIAALVGNKANMGYVLMLFGIVIVTYVIIQCVFLTMRGQDIGKMILKIKIIKKKTGENGGFVTNVLLRAFVNGILGYVPLYGLVDVLFIFSKEQRCVHDLIAGTIVVDATPANSKNS